MLKYNEMIKSVLEIHLLCNKTKKKYSIQWN